MQIINKIMALWLTLPAMSQATSWACEHNNLIREVSIEPVADNAVPCVVNSPS